MLIITRAQDIVKQEHGSSNRIGIGMGVPVFATTLRELALEDICLSGLSNAGPVTAIDNSCRPVSELIHSLSHLKKLSFVGCRGTDAALRAVVRTLSSSLRELCLDDSDVTDDGITSVAEARLTSLEILSLCHCRRVTQRGIQRLGVINQLTAVGL